jgi:hypothetical protein
MIERTKAKLEEARRLLGKLQAERLRQVQQAIPTASPEFLLLLNTFITTARSVLWVLQSEEKEKYDAWQSLPGAMVSPAEKAIFNLVTNSIEKQGCPGIEIRREWVEIPEYPDPFSGSQYSGLPSWGRPEAQIDVYYVNGTSHEVVSLCEQHLSILMRLIKDFEQTHAPQTVCQSSAKK